MESSGIGGYKGVMLCNRPLAATAAPVKSSVDHSSKNNPPPFVTTFAQKEQLGLNRPRQPPVLVNGRPKKDTVMSQHKRFLSDLMKQKKEMEHQMEEEGRLREEKRLRFREKIRLRRLQIVEERRRDEEEKYGDSESMESKRGEYKDEELEWSREEKVPEARSKTKKKHTGKPKWALSKVAVEDLENDEAEELVEFADALNFEEFLDNLEKRAEEHVDVSDDDVKQDGSDMSDSDFISLSDDDADTIGDFSVASTSLDSEVQRRRARRARKKKASAEDGWDSSTKLKDRGDGEDETESIASARSYLSDMSSSSMKSMKQIHSARSLAKIMERVKASSANLAPIEEDAMSMTYETPVIVDIIEDDHARLKQKNCIDKLPYRYRNPAI